jgi:hypothetical protein
VVQDGHVVQTEFSGDYDEGFKYWNSSKVTDAVRASQQQAAGALRALTDSAPAAEKARLEYVTRHVEFMAHYAEAWIHAQALDAVLKRAQSLRKEKRQNEAKALVEKEGLPLWLKLAPEVRQAILRFQGAVATRNDLGTLASLQNKFVRIALDRLPLSMAEFLDAMPAEVEAAVKDARKPDTEAPARVIVPVRPTMLGKGEKVRILAIVPGPGVVGPVHFRLRPAGASQWTELPFKLLGRRTWEAWLELPAATGAVMEYEVAATISGKPVRAPEQGVYRLTVC